MGWLKGRDTDGGAKTQIYIGGSKTVLGFADQAKRRNRVVFIGAGVGLVIAGVTGLGVMKYLEADAAGRVVTSYGELTQCLVGEAPSAADPAGLRVRAMQLTALTQNETLRAVDKAGPWPDRCAKFAHRLSEALEDSAIGDTKGKGLLDSSKALAAALDQKESYWHDLSPAVEGVFAEAEKTGPLAAPAPNVPPPPVRAQPLHLDDLAKAGALTDHAVALSVLRPAAHESSVVRFGLDDAKANLRRLCSVSVDGARCDALPGEFSASKSSLRLFGSSADGVPPALWVDGAAVSSAGAKLVPSGALSAYAASVGHEFVLTESPTGLELSSVEGGNSQRRSVSLGALKLGDARRDAQLLFGNLVVMASSGKELVLAAQRLDTNAAARLDTIGTLPKAVLGDGAGKTDPRIDGCQAGGMNVVRARTGRETFLAFQGAGGWSTPLKTAAHEGTIHCQQGAALTTHIEGGTGEAALDGKLTFQRCSTSECKSQNLVIRELFAGEVGLAPSTPIVFSAIDGKALVVWQAGQRGGLRMRLGAFDTLATAPDVILYDDLVHNGRVSESSTILDMRLFTAERFAVLLIATPVGLRALRIESDGKTVPVTL